VTPTAPSFSGPIAELTGFEPGAVASALEWIGVAPVLVGTFVVIDALGQLLILGGLGIASDDPWIALKLAIISSVLFITAPTSTHALVRAAWREGLRPWLKPGDTEGVLEKDIDHNPVTASASWLVAKEEDRP
jgi:multisubunit Na+/H+ antiporter MnhG subunit